MPPLRLPRSATQYALLLALFVILALFLIYPILLTIGGAFIDPSAHAPSFTTVNVALVFQDPSLRAGLLNSAKMAATSTFLTILLGLPLAVCAARFRYPLKSAFSALILVPLILPPFVGAIGFQALLGREGSLNSLLDTHWDLLGTSRFWGVVLVQTLNRYPIIFLNATAALANLDPALDEAAENLGAGPFRRFFRITLPLIRPGLFAGATIVFVWCFTDLGVPLVFDYTTVTPVQIFFGLKEVETSPQPYALTFVMLAATVVIYALGKLVFGGRAYPMYAKASRAATEHTLPVPAALAVTAAFALITCLALLPHLGVILTAISDPGAWNRSILPMSFTLHNFRLALSHPDAFHSISNSLQLATAATALDLVLGLLVGYLVVRTHLRGRHLLDSLCMLPLAVPGLVMAFGYVAMTLRWPFGKGDILEGFVSVVGATPNPMLLLTIAYAVRRLPYIVRASVAGLEQTSGELEEAAMNLGASRFTAVRKVIVPLIAANLIAGALLAFSFAMLEVSDSLILAQQQRHFPITKQILAFLNRLGDGPSIASAMGVWGMALLTVTLVGASILIGKKLGSIFRA